MKKLIALAVVFGLVAGGLFAADLNVNMATSYNLLKGDNEKIITEKSADSAYKLQKEMADALQYDTDNGTNTFATKWPMLPGETATEYQARLEKMVTDKLEEGPKNVKHGGNKESLYRISTSAGDDKFGGWFRAEAGGGRGVPFNAWGFVWWQPLDILKVYMGNNPDGSNGRDGVAAGWAFYKGAGDGGVVNQGNAWGGGWWNNGNMRDAFFGGTDIEGIMLEVPLNSMLFFMVNLPFFRNPESHANYAGVGADEYNIVLQHVRMQAQVNLDFGNIALTYAGNRGAGVIDPEAATKFANMGKFYVDANIGAIDGLGLNVGVGYPLPATYKKQMVQDDISIGVSADYTLSDTFGIKTRMLGKFGGQTKDYFGKVATKTEGSFGIDIMPYLSLTDTMTLYVSLGMEAIGKQQAAKKKDGLPTGDFKPVKDSDKFGWHFNPYIQIGEGCGNFWAGFKLWCNNAAKSGEQKTILKETKYNQVNFEVPVGITISL